MGATGAALSLLAILSFASAAAAQVVPAAKPGPDAAVFGEFAFNTPGYNPDPARYGILYGGVIGAYVQGRSWIGLEGRGIFLETASQPGHEEHQRAVYFGPRVDFSGRRLGFGRLDFARLDLDGSLLGGVSHSDYPSSPPRSAADGEDLFLASTAPAMEVGGAVNLRINPRLSWRIGEVTYDHAFGADSPHGAIFASGIVISLFRR